MAEDLNFHKTFPPETSCLTRILDVCNCGYIMSKEEIAELTGIPTGKSSGKVTPTIKYAQYMGLLRDEIISGKHKLSLTPLGELIKNEDIGFQENITLWICHIRLCSITGALLWSTLVKNILPKYNYQVKDIHLKDEIKLILKKDIQISPFNSSYDNMFLPLDIIHRNKEYTILKHKHIRIELLYVYAYAVLYEWEALYKYDNGLVREEITEDDFSSMKVAETLGLDYKDYEEMLSLLEEHHILKFNRQLVPYTVIKLVDVKNIIPRLYSLLN